MPYAPQPYREISLPPVDPRRSPFGGAPAGQVPQSGAPEGLRSSSGRVQKPDGSYTNYEDPNALDNELATRDKYNAQADARRYAELTRLSGPGTPTDSAPVPAYDETGARAAAFARAKEQSANIAQSSMTALRSALNRRGVGSGGYANMKAAEALAPAADRLQDFGREQLI